LVQKETPKNILPINSFSDVSVVSNENKDIKEDDHDKIIVLSLFYNHIVHEEYMKEYFQEHYENHISKSNFFIIQTEYDKNYEVIIFSLEDLVAACLESSSGMKFSIFICRKYGYQLHGKFPITLLL
jgi:hypothetical protein